MSHSSSSSRQHPKLKQRRVVLSEEEYTSTLSAVVERDYFPDLPDLRRQVAVLDRRAAGDLRGAIAVRRAARLLQQHEEALAEQEAAEEEEAAVERVRNTPRPLHRESVTGFHARVTSEDNEEFDKTQRQEVKENRERLQRVFANPVLQLTNGEASMRKDGAETPLLASDKFDAPAHRIEARQWKDNTTIGNDLFFPPEHRKDDSVDAPSDTKLIISEATVGNDGDGNPLDRQLMPPPARVQKRHKERNGAAETSIVLKQDLVEYIPKHALEKSIEPSQTRFPVPVVVPPPQQLYGGAESLTDYSTEASTDLDEPERPLSVERRARAKRQRRDVESLVSMTPLVIPGQPGQESPIITWGTVSATPMVLGGEEAASHESFSLPKESVRDEAARQAQRKLEKARRRANAAKRSKTPLLSDRAVASLTPAARSLLEKTTPRVNPSVRSNTAFSSALRSSYTPQRRARRSMQRDHAGKATPRLTPSTASVRSSTKSTVDDCAESSSGDVTDGLLKLP